MKHLKFNLIGLTIASCMVLPSCSDWDDDSSQPYSCALVTVKSTDDNKTFMQLDEQTTLFPKNLSSQLYEGKEVRALVGYDELDVETPGFTKTVKVNWIDSIRTKEMINLPENSPIEKYGSDPVEVINDWVTIVEDGYLTLRLRARWGNIGKVHYFNLIGNVNPDDPFEVELRHNANDDVHGEVGDALIAFRLSSLPENYPADQKLTLKWKSFDGSTKQVRFNMVPNLTANNASHRIQGLKLSADFK